MNFSEILKSLRRKSNLTQEQLASIIGVERSSVGKYESKNVIPSIDVLTNLSNYFNVPIDFLLGKEKAFPKKGVKIPVYGSIAAGIPIDAIEDIIDYEEISEAMADQGEYIALQIKGDSMEPRLRSGDVIIIRKQPDVNSGQVAAVLINGNEATCKIVIKGTKGIDLVSTNPNYKPMHYSNKQIEELPVTIIGLVVEARLKSL